MRGAANLNKLLFILVFLGIVASAEPAPTDAYRHAIEQGVNSGVYQDVAVGWIDGTQRDTWFYGGTMKADAHSVFEIGTATEVFTGLLLAQAAYEGKVRLQTPIRELLPTDFPFADPALGAITAEDLATHRSGLPALPPNLLPVTADDPYADYSEPELRAFLANYRRRSEPGDFAYSPLDAGLLGYLIGRRYGTQYTKLLRDKILLPLGLKDTDFGDSRGLLAGHARGQSTAHWHFAALAGSAGLRSCLGDLLDFAQRNLRPDDSPLRAALLLARQPRARARTQETGLGWNIVEVGTGEQSWPLVWRASETGGFSTFIGFRTDRQEALVLLANSAQDLSALGMAWLEQRPPPPLQPPPPPPPNAAQLADYPGLYQVRGGEEIIVRATADGLSAQLRGQPAMRLHADAEDVFDAGAEGLGISFQREAGKVTSLVLNRDGANFLAQRLSERAPHMVRTPLVLDPKSLHEFAGDYRLDADTLVRIALHTNALRMQMSGRAALSLFAYARDRFADADGSCELLFHRDASGNIISLSLGLAGVERTAARSRWNVPPLPPGAK
jgi:D-alanyl-D-alanine-carboxypeptidase/D-alanyl-D-alanine-endopeptidase